MHQTSHCRRTSESQNYEGQRPAAIHKTDPNGLTNTSYQSIKFYPLRQRGPRSAPYDTRSVRPPPEAASWLVRSPFVRSESCSTNFCSQAGNSLNAGSSSHCRPIYLPPRADVTVSRLIKKDLGCGSFWRCLCLRAAPLPVLPTTRSADSAMLATGSAAALPAQTQTAATGNKRPVKAFSEEFTAFESLSCAAA